MAGRKLVFFVVCAVLLRATTCQPNDGAQAAVTAPDPAKVGAFEYLGMSSCVGVQLAAVPGGDQFLFMERPTATHPDNKHFNAGLMDSRSGEFTNFKCIYSMENCGHSYLEDGTVAILSGHKPQSDYIEGRKQIQVLDLGNKMLRSVATLQYGHWLTTATRLGNGNIVIMSDSPSPVGPGKDDKIKNPLYELWDGKSATTKAFQMDKTFLANTKYFYYPFNFLLPTGDLFVWSNTFGEIINPMTGAIVSKLPSWKGLAPKMVTAYPFSGTAVMLPLTYKNGYKAVEIVVFGGQWRNSWINDTACDLSMRLKIAVNGDGSYNISKWQMEKMPSPRVSGTAVLLPSGQVLLINGAKRGLLGDAAAGGIAMLNEPNMTPVMYDPAGPDGKRYTSLASTDIPRLLHSTAGLTPQGSVILAGGDRSARFWSPIPYNASQHGFAEYRVQLYKPPNTFDAQNKPVIVSAPEVINFDEINTITYTIPDATAEITSVVLVAPSSDTHGFNMNQRVVELEIVGAPDDNNHLSSTKEAKSISVRGPSGPNVAPPMPYMLFLVSSRAYSEATWVKVAAETASDS